MALSIAHTGVLLFLLQIFIGSEEISGAFYTQSSVYTGLIFFMQVYAPVEMLMSIAMMALSRRNEFEADRFSVDVIPDAEALVTGLKKLSSDNLGNLTPHWLHVFVSYSHPPVLARINAIRAYKQRSSSKKYVSSLAAVCPKAHWALCAIERATKRSSRTL